MKKQFVALLLVSCSLSALAQAANPFKPAAPAPTGAQATPGSAPTMAALGGVPQTPQGVPMGPDGRPYPQGAQGMAAQQVGMPAPVPAVPGSGMPAPASDKPKAEEVRVRFVGKVNGQNLYKGEHDYHFDKKKRPSVDLVEDRSVSPPTQGQPATTAGPKPGTAH